MSFCLLSLFLQTSRPMTETKETPINICHNIFGFNVLIFPNGGAGFTSNPFICCQCWSCMELSALASSSFLRKKSSIWLNSDCICQVFSFKKVFNFFFQQSSRFVQVPFGCSGRNSKDARDFFMLKSFYYKQVKYKSRILR